MKKFFLVLLTVLSLTSCRKTNDDPFQDNIRQILKSNLSEEDYRNIDFSTFTKSVAKSTGQQMVRVGFTEKNLFHDFILLNFSNAGKMEAGKIVHITGSVTQVSPNTKLSFNGSIETSSLKREDKTSSAIVNGFIRSLHESKITLNGVRMNVACADCTLPEVIVSTSHTKSYDWTTAWLSIWSMFGDWPPNEYIPIDYSGGGGGGGGNNGSSITIDIEPVDNKTPIDSKKYTDCFGKISDNLATYSLTIAADLPVDGHPETFFNWGDGSPGHAFIQLSKSNPYETVTQNIGFYPATSWTVLSGQDVNSKIIDDGGHEYNAKYTITVTASQFQAAIAAVASNSSTRYNVSNYNCTDFALAVFGAAGGSVPMYRHPIPNFGVPGGSNTPQGLYEAIRDLNSSGKTGANMAPGKEYTVGSHGPCN